MPEAKAPPDEDGKPGNSRSELPDTDTVAGTEDEAVASSNTVSTGASAEVVKEGKDSSSGTVDQNPSSSTAAAVTTAARPVTPATPASLGEEPSPMRSPHSALGNWTVPGSFVKPRLIRSWLRTNLALKQFLLLSLLN